MNNIIEPGLVNVGALVRQNAPESREEFHHLKKGNWTQIPGQTIHMVVQELESLIHLILDIKGLLIASLKVWKEDQALREQRRGVVHPHHRVSHRCQSDLIGHIKGGQEYQFMDKAGVTKGVKLNDVWVWSVTNVATEREQSKVGNAS